MIAVLIQKPCEAEKIMHGIFSCPEHKTCQPSILYQVRKIFFRHEGENKTFSRKIKYMYIKYILKYIYIYSAGDLTYRKS